MNDFTANLAVVYADLDDEVTALFESARRARRKQVALVIPAQAGILSSLVNLKILKHKLRQAELAVTIVTADAAGRRLAAEAGFVVAERVQTRGQESTLFNVSQPELAPAREKLGRKKLELKEVETPESKPLAIDEIPMARLPQLSGFRKIWFRLAGGVAEVESEGESQARYVVRRPSGSLLFFLLASAAALLFFVIYIAVPSATVYLAPRADPIEKVVAVQLSDAAAVTPAQTAAVAAEFFDVSFTTNLRIGATGKIFEGTNAKGTVTLYNRSPREKFLVPSRFKNQDGIMFRSLAAVTIPAGTAEQPGTIQVELEACTTDDERCDCVNNDQSCRGEFQGDRGNVGKSFFVLPAIPSISPSLHWAESTEPFTGGTTKITPFISAEDLANVRSTVERDIVALARVELDRAIAQQEAVTGTDLTLLTAGRNAMPVTIADITIPPNLENTQVADFTVTVRARVRGVAYDEQQLRAVLYDALQAKVHPEKVLSSVQYESVAIGVEDLNLDQKNARVAATITGVESFDISESGQAGARLIERIRGRILGQPVEESEALIRNLPEIRSAEIVSWPFWSATVPALPENVKFRVQAN